MPLNLYISLMSEFEVTETLYTNRAVRIYKVVSDSGKEYAVKRINTSYLDEETIKRIENEILILKSCKHINIIKVYDYKIVPNHIQILMEFVDGESLKKIVKRRSEQKLKYSTILTILIQILFSVKYLHDRKVVHRHLSCSNILITRKGVVKIIGFGSNKLLTYTNEYIETNTGENGYTAPEVILGQEYSNKVDIWSIGCILYELITCSQFYYNSLVVLSLSEVTLPSSCPDNLSTLIHKMLQKEPENRPSINDVLKEPFILSAAKVLYGDSFLKDMEHTVFHGYKAMDSPRDYGDSIDINYLLDSKDKN